MAVRLLDLQLIYGVAGAREKFERLTAQLVKGEHDSALTVRVKKGDSGIDVYIGDFASPAGIDVFQAKFFPNGLDDAQKSQIRKSFRQCRRSPRFKVRSWTLCLPCDLSADESEWFDFWKAKQTGVKVNTPWTATRLEQLLNEEKNRGLKESYFKQQHLAMIRETHTLVSKLVTDFNDRVPPPTRQILIPHFKRAEAVKCHRDGTRVLAAIRVWWEFENPGPTMVREWGAKMKILRKDVEQFVVLPEQCPGLRKGLGGIQLNRAILPTLSLSEHALIGVPIDSSIDLHGQLLHALSPAQMRVTPVTENHACDPTVFDFKGLIDFDVLSEHVAEKLKELHRSEAPKQVSFPVGHVKYDFERDRLTFPAVADGKTIRCIITEEALMDHFRLPYVPRPNLEQVVHEHEVEIRAAMLALIQQGGIGDEVVITSDREWPT